jgi:hypothetical protein
MIVPMRALVFDFFGTLTDPGAEADRRSSFGATAAAIEGPEDAFWLAMSGSFGERVVGRYGGTRDTLRAIAARCGANPRPMRNWTRPWRCTPRAPRSCGRPASEHSGCLMNCARTGSGSG